MLAYMSNNNLIILIFGIIIIFLFGLIIYKNIKKIKFNDKKEKKNDYECSVISKREYSSKNGEKFYYITFLINDEEKEYIVPKTSYLAIYEGQFGILTLLKNRVFIDFISK